VEAVARHPDCLVVWLVGLPPVRLRLLSLSEPTPEAAAELERWALAGTSLLQVRGPEGEVTLCGPTGSVVGLQDVSDRTRSDSGHRTEESGPVEPRASASTHPMP